MTTAELGRHLSFVFDGQIYKREQDHYKDADLPVIDWLGPDLVMMLIRNLNKKPNLKGVRREILFNVLSRSARSPSFGCHV
mgnify:CR=1 FL=1